MLVRPLAAGRPTWPRGRRAVCEGNSRSCPRYRFTVTRWRIKSPASRLFTQPFNHAQIKENTKAPRYWPFVWGIHWSLVNSPHKGQWRGALVFSLICAWLNGWVNNREAGDLIWKIFPFDGVIVSCKDISTGWKWLNWFCVSGML